MISEDGENVISDEQSGQHGWPRGLFTRDRDVETFETKLDRNRDILYFETLVETSVIFFVNMYSDFGRTTCVTRIKHRLINRQMRTVIDAITSFADTCSEDLVWNGMSYFVRAYLQN